MYISSPVPATQEESRNVACWAAQVVDGRAGINKVSRLLQ